MLEKAKLLLPPVPKREVTADELDGADEVKVRVDVVVTGVAERTVREEVLGKEEVTVREEAAGRKDETGTAAGRKEETGAEETTLRREEVLGREERTVREAVEAGDERTLLEDPRPLLLDDPVKEVETVFLMNGVNWEMIEPTRSESPDVTAFWTTSSTAGRPRI